MRRLPRNIVCADRVTMLHFGKFLIHIAGFGWRRNPVTIMSAGLFTRPEGDTYAIDWDEAYGGVFVIPEDLQPLFRDFCAGAPVSSHLMH